MTVYKMELNEGHDHKAELFIGKKPLILLAYMNGCGPCGALKLTWDPATKSVKNVTVLEIESALIAHVVSKHPNTILGKILAHVSGFPTILYVPPNKKGSIDLVEFKEARTKDHLVEFIKRAKEPRPAKQQAAVAIAKKAKK